MWCRLPSLLSGLVKPPVTDLCQCMGRVMGMHAGIPKGAQSYCTVMCWAPQLCCRHERMHAGNPKGVVLSHSKVLAMISALQT